MKNAFMDLSEELAMLQKDNGQIIDSIYMIFSKNKIFMKDVSIKIDIKDKIIRKKTGEEFLVIKPCIYDKFGSIPAHYQIEFTRNMNYFEKSDNIIPTITYINANNSNIHFGDMINSSQKIIKSDLDLCEIGKLIESISKNIHDIGLSIECQNKLNENIDIIKDAIQKKDTDRVKNVLSVIKDMCYNVSGNLIASGIIQQISTFLP